MFYILVVTAVAVLIFVSLVWRSQKKFSYVCLVGKTALVTGAARGIGYYTALGLAARGCRVILADILDAEQAKHTIIKETNNTNITVKYLDLTDLECVRKFAKEINDSKSRLDILINNAGVGARRPQKTKDGLDLIMQTNYFGGFLLTHLLADKLKKSAPSRIIFVSSCLSWLGKISSKTLNESVKKNKYFFLSEGTQLYANSKFCDIIAADGFAERLNKFNVTSIPVRPMAATYTRIINESDDCNISVFNWCFNPWPLVFKIIAEHPSETAEHIVYASVAQELEGVKKQFFCNSQECWKPFQTRNKQYCDSIWRVSEELVGLEPNERLSSC